MTPETAPQPADDSDAVFRVLVRGPKRDKFWRSYPSRALAQAATARLRALGLDARVVRIGEGDEETVP